MGPERASDDTRPGAGDLLSKLRDGAQAPARGSSAGHPAGTPSGVSGIPGLSRLSGAGRDSSLGPTQGSDRPDLQRRVMVAAAATIVAGGLAVAGAGSGPGSVVAAWLALAMSVGAAAWCGWPLHLASVTALRRLRVTTDTAASAATALLAVLGVALLAGAGTRSGAWLDLVAPAAVTTLLLVARLLEGRAAARLRAPVQALLDHGVSDVAVLRIDPRHRATSETRVGVVELAVGDHFVVHPGETVAADGRVVEGTSTVDPGLATGEEAAEVGPGDPVPSGAVNRTSRLVVEATRVGRPGLLATTQRVLRAAIDGPPPAHRLADRLAPWFAPATLAVGFASAVAWFVLGEGGLVPALRVAAAVLLAASPAALALATGRAWLGGVVAGARAGTLLARPTAADPARRPDSVVISASGALTTGTVELQSIAVVGSLSKKAALKAAAAVAQGSDDQVSRAVVAGARLARIDLPRITDFQATRDEGASARIKDTEVTIGEPRLFEEVDPTLLAHAESSPGTTVYVGWGGSARAALTVGDTLREEAPAGVRALLDLGLAAHVTTPAGPATAQHLARQHGLDPDRAHPGVEPKATPAVITGLQRQGRVVAFVAAGRADTAGMDVADLAVAIRAEASDTVVLADHADLVTVRPGVGDVAGALRLARATGETVRRGATFALAYTPVAVVAAASGVLHPIAAAALASVASLAPVANATRLVRNEKAARPA